ncbi:hypothetical protein NUU61_002878 [Penicillium alfredii]|uniref:Uncharacterized protein n=1 Tax=Penicillium alfredii TaxID=1506179 RepID=A0A9W9FSB2_9EURO|nr:uncharacterized protein NUU61_002878 [Penicillium alfredii]KAJ5105531.1 hypothetical protein NUU61_002878 [Penicillium alfredii]
MIPCSITIPALEGVDGSLEVTSDANINCSIFEDIKISRSASCKSNGKATKLDSASGYSNAEPTASVGNPASMTFAPDKDNSGVRPGLEWGGRMGIPLLAAVVLTL